MSQDPLSSPPLASYRVSLFFGPEAVEHRPGEVACVFNVKKRSWKAGIQVAVEIHTSQLSSIRNAIRLGDRLSPALSTLETKERPEYEARARDLFTQAVCWCKLDLRLQSGLTPENQRISSDELVTELEAAMETRTTYAVTYVLTELDLAHQDPSRSSVESFQ